MMRKSAEALSNACKNIKDGVCSKTGKTCIIFGESHECTDHMALISMILKNGAHLEQLAVNETIKLILEEVPSQMNGDELQYTVLSLQRFQRVLLNGAPHSTKLIETILEAKDEQQVLN